MPRHAVSEGRAGSTDFPQLRTGKSSPLPMHLLAKNNWLSREHQQPVTYPLNVYLLWSQFHCH